jgi:hypothetical protein
MLAFQERRKNQKGMAIIELVPIMIIILLLFNFSIGFFGVIHTGILNSIAARNYAFETFRHRSNLVYFRENVKGDDIINYKDVGLRLHAIVSENKKSSDQFVATGRPIDFMSKTESAGGVELHNSRIYDVIDGKRYTAGEGVSPVWIRPQYGICLNANCGAK